VSSLAVRMGLDEEVVRRASANGDLSGSSSSLFDRAFAAGPTDPEVAGVLLAAAVLQASQEAMDSRLKSTLALLARLVAKAPVRKTLGPAGRALREELMPSGWKDVTASWPKIRYAWREGLVELLEPPDSELGTVEALDEVTRLHANEPDPVPVAIQETWPSPPVTFALSVIGTALAVRSVVKEMREIHHKRRGR
jgi:hypothetical protein